MCFYSKPESRHCSVRTEKSEICCFYLFATRSNLTLPATGEMVLPLRDCFVPDTRINVRYALKPQVVSAPRMRDIFVGATTYTVLKIIESGNRWDLPLRPDELPFEFDGRGAAQWYYMDVEQVPPGVLTWQKLRTTFEGLTLCTLHRNQYNALYFEIWERTQGGDRSIRVGTGEFGTKVQATNQ